MLDKPADQETETHPRFPGFVEVSSVDVDAGCIWVGDPCYVLKDPNEARPTDLGANWSDICSRFFDRSGYNAMQKAFRDHQYRAREEIQKTPEHTERFDAYIAALKELDAEARKPIAQEFFAWEREQERAWLDANPFDPAEKLDKGFANFTHDMGHGGMGTMISTNYGDGTYPVYIKYGKNGRPSQVLIDFCSGDAEYDEPIAEEDTVYTVEQFKELVASESIIDSDGDAYPSNGTHYDLNQTLDIAYLEYLDDDTTHIVWANN